VTFGDWPRRRYIAPGQKSVRNDILLSGNSENRSELDKLSLEAILPVNRASGNGLGVIAAGIRLGLGTDGPAGSNNDLSLMEEMDLAAKLQKVTQRDPRALNAEQVLDMATIGGARALHLEAEIGSLEPGKKADLIILALDAPNAVPLYDLYAQVVYSLKGEDVRMVVIGGRVVMQERRVLTIDQRAVISHAREYAEKVKESLEQPQTAPRHSGAH